MTFEDIKPFFEQNHRGVVTTRRRNGAVQASIVASGVMGDAVVFVSRGDSAKIANIKRDPGCTVMATKADWSSYAVWRGPRKFAAGITWTLSSYACCFVTPTGPAAAVSTPTGRSTIG